MVYLGTPIVTILDPPSFRSGLRTSINVNALCARDGWMCGLCRLPIEKYLWHGRSTRAAGGKSIDHIIPISWGGPDTDENLQAAHWECNHLKGNALNDRDF